MCIQVYIKLDFGINIGQIRLANKTWISVFDVRGRDKVQRWVGVGAKGGGGCGIHGVNVAVDWNR